MAHTARTPRGTRNGGVGHVPLWQIHPAPENDKLYRPVLESDPEIVALAESIRRWGLREPLVLSDDDYILSGHRRFAACRLAGLRTVPVRREHVRREDNPDKFVTLLREYNRQRVKSLDEQIREAVIDADPDEARAELLDYRRAAAKVGHVPLLLVDGRPRRRISQAKDEFLAAVLKVLEDRRDFWPLSDRQIHYPLLNDPPLKHRSKPDSRYRNDQASYKALCDLLTRARLTGLIPFEAIGDETRPFTSWCVHREPGAFVAQEIDAFLKGYFRDLMQSQPNHVEVVVEKNTVAGIVRPVCADFCIPMTSGRGYCSLPPRHAMAQRFEQSGKAKLVVLLVSDFDPDGEEIAASFARSMRDDFGVADLHPIKVALTAAQVREHKLPPAMIAKASSSRTKGFVAKHGSNVWELEALPPETLQQIVRDTITQVIDLDLFNTEQRAEAADAAKLKAIRQQVQESLRGLKLEGGDE
jgi:hypothetical protein